MKGSLTPGRIFLMRLARGADLWESISGFCVGNAVKLAEIQGIGAVEKAVFGYYDQATREYQTITVAKPLEITSLLGNVSLLDGQPFLHAHATFTDRSGAALGGHLFKGTIVFSVEVRISELTGGGLVRNHDPDTGLPLWGL